MKRKKERNITKKKKVRVWYQDRRTGKFISRSRYRRLAPKNRRQIRRKVVIRRSKVTGRYIKKGALRVDRLTQLKAEYRPDPATPRQLSALLDLAEFFEESVTLFDPDAESFQIENYIQAAAYMLKVPQQFTQGQLDAARRIVKEAKVSGMVTRTATVKRKKRTS